MTDHIDDETICAIISGAIGSCESIHEAQCSGMYVTPARDKAIELALPLGYKLARVRFNRLASSTRITLDDLRQHASIGVIRGIDFYEPRHDPFVKVSTFLTTWISKWLTIEIDENHWSALKPAKDLRRKYLGNNKMTDEERASYECTFMSYSDAGALV